MNPQQRHTESLERVKSQLRGLVNNMYPQMAKEWINELQREINKANDDIDNGDTYRNDIFQIRYRNTLYQYMAYKKYTDLVTADFHSTRMDANLTSIIDHVLVSSSAKRHITQD